MKIQDDEYMLVRKKDNAVIINRLFLSDNGLSSMPAMAEQGDNKELANSVNKWLESERAGRVSFGVIK